jgi:hypothetical protein
MFARGAAPRPMGEYTMEPNAPGGSASPYAGGMGNAPDPSMGGYGSLVSYPVNSFGATRGPRGNVMKVAAAISPFAGALGDAADAVAQKRDAKAMGDVGGTVGAGFTLAVIGLGLVLRGGAGYVVGRALAPRGEEAAYAWGGVLASIFFGSLGLGVEALIANSDGD